MDPTGVGEEAVAAAVRAARERRPRVLATAERIAAFKRRVSEDPAAAALADAVVAEARGVLAKPPLEHKKIGRRLLGVSREALRRQVLLRMAWLRTDDPVFAQGAARELDAVCAFEDWNPSHFLDAAEMSLAVAIGLDGFGEALPDETRRAARAALINLALRPSFEKHSGWVRARNNWGQVCHAGLTAAALAILDEEPELAIRTIHRAVVNVPCSMAAYAPDGGYPEGPGYWNYGTSFNVVLIDCLEGALGTDFGLSRLPGFLGTGEWLLLTTGPTGRTLNFSDGRESTRREATLLWFAARGACSLPANAPEAAWLRGETGGFARDRLAPLALFHLPAHAEAAPSPRPLDWRGHGEVPVTVHRSGWDADAWFVGTKGGSPKASHGHMDGGAFVLEALGRRWIVDPGSEDYHRIESRGMGLWNSAQDGDRWRVFRIGTRAHNTLMIDGLDQRVGGRAVIADFGTDPAEPFTQFDLSSLYAGSATRVGRRIALPGRCRLTVQDELDGVRPGGSVRWMLMTPAEVERGGDGRRVTLRLGDQALTLRIEPLQGATEAAWQVCEVASLLAEWDSPLPGLRQLFFEAAAPADGRLAWRVVIEGGAAD